MTKTRPPVSRLKAKVAEIMARKAPLRPIDQEVANERESSAKVGENSERVRAKLAALAANNTYAPPRRDMLGDRDIFEEIQRSLRTGHIVSLTSRTPGAVIGGGRALTTKRTHWIEMQEKARIKAGEPIDVIRRRPPVHLADWEAIAKVDRARRKRGELQKIMWVPHWDRTGDMLKGFAWSMAVWERDGAIMTVNIGDSVIAAAKRDPRGFAAHMRERLKRELGKAAERVRCRVPEFFFVVEASELGKPHLHGGITLSGDERQQKAIREALFWASYGRDPEIERTGREVRLQPFLTPAIWTNYAAKWWRGSADRLDGRTFAASTSVRAWGKEWYMRMRATETKIEGHEPDDDLFSLP